MASHVYYRVGRWHDGVAINRRAVEIDTNDATRWAGLGWHLLHLDVWAQQSSLPGWQEAFLTIAVLARYLCS